MSGVPVHGHAGRSGQRKSSPTYNSWRAMIARCWHPARRDFKYYGGRGIQVDPAWLVPPRGHGGFAQFLSDLGERPEGMTLDRIDVNGHYEATNCQWATVADQNSSAHRQRNGYAALEEESERIYYENRGDLNTDDYAVRPKWPQLIVVTHVVTEHNPEDIPF